MSTLLLNWSLKSSQAFLRNHQDFPLNIYFYKLITRGMFYNVYISLYKIYDNSNNINIYNVVRRENINLTQHYFYKRPAFYTTQ